MVEVVCIGFLLLSNMEVLLKIFSFKVYFIIVDLMMLENFVFLLLVFCKRHAGKRSFCKQVVMALWGQISGAEFEFFLA